MTMFNIGDAYGVLYNRIFIYALIMFLNHNKKLKTARLGPIINYTPLATGFLLNDPV